MDDHSKEKQKNSMELNPLSNSAVRTSRSDEAVTSTMSGHKANSFKDVKFAVNPMHIHDHHHSAGSSPETHRNVKLSSSDLHFNSKEAIDRQDSRSSLIHFHSPKISRKYFTNWRHACDKTKDRTKELLKRWRTLPEAEAHHQHHIEDDNEHSQEEQKKQGGWSVHVWTTWVNRCSIDGGDGEDNDESEDEDIPERLSSLQAEKLSLFFTEILDMDRDDLVTEQDFEHFCEKLAHFADWSTNSPEYHILLEVKNEFVENFIDPLPSRHRDKTYWRKLTEELPMDTVDCENWLARWSLLLPPCSRFHKLPLFLQYFCKILFGVINKSGSGQIDQEEMRAFYMAIIGLNSKRCDEILDTAFRYLTSNNSLRLDFETYKRCYSNWLCGKNPNGPGQWLLVPPKGPISKEPFPVDYSALNADPAHLERYTPNNKSNRHSVIV